MQIEVVLVQMQQVSFLLFNRISIIIFLFVAAWLIHRVARRVANYVLRINRLTTEQRRWRPERLETLRGLFSSAVTFLAFTLATVASLSLFIDVDTIIWLIGLFSAGVGLGARPIISDYLTGLGFIFEDTVDVGEKVEFAGSPGGPYEGVVEEINLRVTVLRAISGEQYVIPNGEIRIIRNYSRGRFSITKVKFKVPGSALEDAIAHLEVMGQDAVSLLPNLLEPWEVISPGGEVGPTTELLITAKSRFGQAAKMRPRLLALVQKGLTDANIELTE